MSSIDLTLEPKPDGTLHVPLPPELRSAAQIKVVATLVPLPSAITPSGEPTLLKGFGCLAGKITLASDFDAPIDDFRDYTR